MDEPKTVLLNDLTLHRQRSGVGCYVAQLMRCVIPSETGIRLVPLTQTLGGAPLRLLSKLYQSGRRREEAQNASRFRRLSSRLVARGASAFREIGHSLLNAYVRGACRMTRWPLYHEPDALPLAIHAPTVTTVHDLSVILFPQWHPSHRVLKYERNLCEAIARTRLFVAVSQTTKDDMIRHLGVQADRIIVVPEAPRPEFRVLSKTAVAETKTRLNLDEKYLLFVGTIEPRKNVKGLLQAYRLLPSALRSRCSLYLAGGWGWNSSDVREMLFQSPFRQSVRWLGYLSDHDLVAVMNGAEAVVYPSHYEGFGLPPLEAMACDRPVITTHAGSLAEVVGSAAMIVDPNDETQLSHAMADILVHRELADEYRRRGRERLHRFSWNETARRTAEVYRRVA